MQVIQLIFPHHLVSADFQGVEDILPVEYKPAMEQFLYLQNALAYKYSKVYKKPNFPQNENFNWVYATEDPDDDLFFAFQGVADTAYSDDTRLLPDEDISITVPRQVLVFREEDGNNDEWVDNPTYATDGLECSDCKDDEKLPHKMQ
ncbi:uncharacterized protein BT62DRAFT_1054439 [Guyanagaster necrorhizus]|uniref:Uncharacterized protein n=1 Tax=Guyanagaster necrorhizus TaxID=856835 RepID=A0A9P7VYT8_9AGAR|nr:uncharacterized protein BT62DRAFT_1054439 [Guyanagaster necrorhizus MCA 3950]KAG7449447.1 hypothetical protein BT62DRAFT_1054439 [Guyanagaster necrorhizus MCA 3950]